MHKSLLLVTVFGLYLCLQATPPPKYPIGDWPEAWHPNYPEHRFKHTPGAPTYLEVITAIETQRQIAERNRHAALLAQQALIAAQQAAQRAPICFSESSPRAMAR